MFVRSPPRHVLLLPLSFISVLPSASHRSPTTLSSRPSPPLRSSPFPSPPLPPRPRPQSAKMEEDAGDYLYNLVGILVHAGVAQGGHYYSYIRDSGKSAYENGRGGQRGKEGGAGGGGGGQGVEGGVGGGGGAGGGGGGGEGGDAGKVRSHDWRCVDADAARFFYGLVGVSLRRVAFLCVDFCWFVLVSFGLVEYRLRRAR